MAHQLGTFNLNEEFDKALEIYALASGQQVNFSKSAVIFSKNTPEAVANELTRMISIKKVGGFGRYLGLPDTIGKNTNEIFSYIQHRVEGKIDSWYSQLLSPAGKEIMIKAVATALPVYPMSCFILPNRVIKKMTQAIRRFWWSAQKDNDKIAWIAWKKITKPKKQGGLGIRDLKLFNQALVAKQTWRIFTQPNSLLARIYKAKYFVKTSLLDAATGSGTSHAWKGIYRMVPLIKNGIRWTIGDGGKTRLFTDNWLVTDPPRPPKAKDDAGTSNLMVADILDSAGKCWNDEKIAALIHPDDIDKVKSIRPSWTRAKDKVEWIHTNNGEYTAKSGYFSLSNDTSNVDDELRQLLAKVWKLEAPPKIKHFWWRVIHDSLPVGSQLKKRKLRVDPICYKCGEATEDLNHCLFKCRVANEVWELAKMRGSQVAGSY